MISLKPCPFCGSENLEIWPPEGDVKRHLEEAGCSSLQGGIDCIDCGIETVIDIWTQEEMDNFVNMWNRRP